MNTQIIHFPKFTEIERLCKRNNIDFVRLNDEERMQIKQTISSIRKAKGMFNHSHFKVVIEYLKHDWLPQDIPVLLP